MTHRAGLALFLLILSGVGLVTSAPLFKRSYDPAPEFGAYKVALSARFLGALFVREPDFAGIAIHRRASDVNAHHLSEFETVGYGHAKRGFEDLNVEHDKRDTSETHVLYRRRSIFTKIRDAFRHAFHKVGEGFKKFGHIVKKGFQKAGAAIKTGFKKVGTVLKKGFQKVGHFIKTTGAKIAKFGLKVAAAITSVASKVLKVIPGLGEGLSIGAKALAKGLSTASDKIHASLGKKLDKAMHGMNYVISPIGTAVKSAGKKAHAGGVVADLLA